MCGRFTITSDAKSIEEYFDLARMDGVASSYNISPASDVPVVHLADGRRVLSNMHWGLVPHWARDTKIQPINAKAETVDSKPFFRSSFNKNRCLIPATGFYEWKRANNHKQPYYFKLKDSELMAFAGLWDHREQDGEGEDSCTIITTEANTVMKPIHDRMPVILKPDDYDTWLREGGKGLLAPYTGDMIVYPVSTAVNNPRHNGRDLIEPVTV